MGYLDLHPDDFLVRSLRGETAEGAWCARWDQPGLSPAETVRLALPETLDFHTSGTTGDSVRWTRTRENCWLEAGMLADLLATDRPGAVVSFVPPAHIYGALATLLVPARLRVPVWYRSGFFGEMPNTGQRRIVVAATPWIFTLLLQHLDWVRSLEQITVLHSSAMLPASALDFLAAAEGRARIVEILGSTEAGGIATRSWAAGAPPAWTLMDDVAFASGPDDVSSGEDEIPLIIRSPRLAFRPGTTPAPTWHADDYVQPLDDRTFHFTGRRTRLVKVNGRRVNLDSIEHQLRAILDCSDLAALPVADDMIGEHMDLLLVLRPGQQLSDLALKAAVDRIGFRPRRIQEVPRIDRSEAGKLRRIQPSLTSEVGVNP